MTMAIPAPTARARAVSGGRPMMTAVSRRGAPQAQGGGFGTDGADEEFPRIVRSGLRRRVSAHGFSTSSQT